MSTTENSGIYVYLMREVNKNLVKIGFSNCVYSRKENLYTQKGYVLKVISFKKFETLSIARQVESFLHNQYHHRRIEGELFALTQTEVEDIMSYFAQTAIEEPENYFTDKPKIYQNYKSKDLIYAQYNELKTVKEDYNQLLAKHNQILNSVIPESENVKENLDIFKVRTNVFLRIGMQLPFYEKKVKGHFMTNFAFLFAILSFMLFVLLMFLCAICDNFGISLNNAFLGISFLSISILFYSSIILFVVYRKFLNKKAVEDYEDIIDFVNTSIALIEDNKESIIFHEFCLDKFNKIIRILIRDRKLMRVLAKLTSWYFQPFQAIEKSKSFAHQ